MIDLILSIHLYTQREREKGGHNNTRKDINVFIVVRVLQVQAYSQIRQNILTEYVQLLYSEYIQRKL